MDEEESINEMLFDVKRAPKVQVAAISDLAHKLGRTVDEMDGTRMGDLVDLAHRCYGEDLPEYWQVWIDWSRHQERPEMGDL